jgi:hypothetical protein
MSNLIGLSTTASGSLVDVYSVGVGSFTFEDDHYSNVYDIEFEGNFLPFPWSMSEAGKLLTKVQELNIADATIIGIISTEEGYMAVGEEECYLLDNAYKVITPEIVTRVSTEDLYADED